MSLLEQLEEDKKALKELEGKDAETNPEIVEDKPADKPAQEEKPEPEPKPESEVKEEIAKSPAQLRVEKRNKEKVLETQVADERAARLRAEARIAELERPAVKVEESDPEPSAAEDPTAHLAWENRQLRQQVENISRKTDAIERKESVRETKNSALAEVSAFENDIRGKVGDYDAAKNYYANFEAYIIKRDNPNMNPAQLNEAVTFKMMKRLAHFQNEGYENPVEAMYEEAKTLGYRPQQAAEVEEKPAKPDLDKVARNKSRTAGTAGATGAGGRGEITFQHLAREMTVAEIAKLPKGEVDRILKNQQGA